MTFFTARLAAVPARVAALPTARLVFATARLVLDTARFTVLEAAFLRDATRRSLAAVVLLTIFVARRAVLVMAPLAAFSAATTVRPG